MYVCTYVCMNECISIYMYICMCVFIYVNMCVCMYLCMYICVWIYMYLCMYECSRIVQKVSGLTTVHEADKPYGVLTLIVFIIHSSAGTHLAQHCCHFWKHFASSPFGMSTSVFVEFLLMSSVASNRCPFRSFLSFGDRKKSHSAKYVEYGCCCSWVVPCWAKHRCTRCELCESALSWCMI